jgi:predicted CoA-binding protein
MTPGREETVAIIGASTDRRKFGNKALRAYARQGFRVIPIHPSAKAVEGFRAYASLRDVPGSIDRVTMYVPAEVGVRLLDDIAAVRPRELWVNPGAESPDLISRARALGLEPILACSILAIGEAPGAF